MKNLLLISLLLASTAQGATLTWNLPTERVNGMPLDPEEITEIAIYRNGELYTTYDAATSSEAVEDVCEQGVAWALTVSASSAPSVATASVAQSVDEVGCIPKPATDFGF